MCANQYTFIKHYINSYRWQLSQPQEKKNVYISENNSYALL